MNAGCPAIFARPETFLFLGLAGGCSLAILYVAAHADERSRALVQVVAGVIVGMFLQPSLSLRALARRALITGVALFALGLAGGLAALILTSTTPARC